MAILEITYGFCVSRRNQETRITSVTAEHTMIVCLAVVGVIYVSTIAQDNTEQEYKHTAFRLMVLIIRDLSKFTLNMVDKLSVIGPVNPSSAATGNNLQNSTPFITIVTNKVEHRDTRFRWTSMINECTQVDMNY